MKRGCPRRQLSLPHGAEEVGFRFNGRGAACPLRQIGEGGRAARGIGKRHHRAAVDHAIAGAKLRRPVEREDYLIGGQLLGANTESFAKRHALVNKGGEIGLCHWLSSLFLDQNKMIAIRSGDNYLKGKVGRY